MTEVPRPKVMICCLTTETIKAITVFNALIPMLQTTNAIWKIKNIQAGGVAFGYNMFVEWVLSLPEPPDFCLFVEHDMIFPPNGLDRLLAHNLDCVGATYRKRSYPFDLIDFGLPLSPPIQNPRATGVHEWQYMPCGFLLTRTDVFRALKCPWFWDTPGTKHTGFETQDCNFSRYARTGRNWQGIVDCDVNFKVCCDYDLSREVVHIVDGIPLPFMIPIPFNEAAAAADRR